MSRKNFEHELSAQNIMAKILPVFIKQLKAASSVGEQKQPTTEHKWEANMYLQPPETHGEKSLWKLVVNIPTCFVLQEILLAGPKQSSVSNIFKLNYISMNIGRKEVRRSGTLQKTVSGLVVTCVFPNLISSWWWAVLLTSSSPCSEVRCWPSKQMRNLRIQSTHGAVTPVL